MHRGLPGRWTQSVNRIGGLPLALDQGVAGHPPAMMPGVRASILDDPVAPKPAVSYQGDDPANGQDGTELAEDRLVGREADH
jgi:hypothetical protein